jgi:hypothetical protein
VSEDQLKGKDLGKDEDVEGHAHKGAPVDSHKAANDEGEDVEGHMHKANVSLASHKAANDEDDDVEAHMHKAMHKAQHKA